MIDIRDNSSVYRILRLINHFRQTGFLGGSRTAIDARYGIQLFSHQKTYLFDPITNKDDPPNVVSVTLTKRVRQKLQSSSLET